MTTFLIVLLCTGIVSTITYAGLSLGYHHRIAGAAHTRFETFTRMYKIAPDKWNYNDYFPYLIYYPDGKRGYRMEYVYMNSYFEHLQLYFWMKLKNREHMKEVTNKKTEDLYECFLHDALGTSKGESHDDDKVLVEQGAG